MRISGLTVSIMAALAVSGCVEQEAPAAPTKLSPEVKLTAKGKSLPVERIVAVKLQPLVGATDARKSVPIHTAVCELKSDTFKAHVERSGFVNLPVYGANTPPLQVSCSHMGHSETRTYRPIKTGTPGGGFDWGYGAIFIEVTGVARHDPLVVR